MIKYRVWDNIQQKYIDNRDVSIDGNGILTVVGIEGKYHMSVQPPNDLAPRFIIEQYTGLKDKNGMEIAVGDIVTIKHDNWDIQELRRVKYYGQFGYPAFDFSPSFDDVENGLSIVTQSDFYSVEVIGNIHENAELLEM